MINDRVKEVRECVGLSQSDFAARLGFTRGVIANIELNRTELKPLFISLLCKTYNVNETWLRTGEGEMFNSSTMEEELAAFVGDVISGSDEFKQRLVLALSRLSPEGWKVFEQFVDDLSAKTKKDPE